MRNARRTVAPLMAGTLLFAAACAGGMPTPTVGPNDIAALEAVVERSPEDVDARTLLGVAYYNAGRAGDAIATLERARAAGATESIVDLHIGLAHESLGHWQQASDAYAAFLADASAHGELRDMVRNRVALVQRELMLAELRAMVEKEDALAAQPARPRTVAVMPFRIVADDPRFEPLQYALADMVTTDLGIPGALQLLERAQIQALVREVALTLAGYTEAASGARIGRLMRAAHVVQGSVVMLGADRLRMEMAVVDAAVAERAGETGEEAALERIFDAEKQLVLEVLDILGVALTPADRDAIEENRTASLLALLAYGEGLGALDRGDYGAAAAAFGNAAAIDPTFQAAQAKAEEAAGLEQAASTGGSEVAAAAQAELVVPTPAAGLALVDQIIPAINPSGADQTTGTAAEGNELVTEPTREARNEPLGVPVTIRIPNPQRGN